MMCCRGVQVKYVQKDDQVYQALPTESVWLAGEKGDEPDDNDKGFLQKRHT